MMQASGYTCPRCGSAERQNVHEHHHGLPYRLSCHRCEHIWTRGCGDAIPAWVTTRHYGHAVSITCQLARDHPTQHFARTEDGQTWTWTH